MSLAVADDVTIRNLLGEFESKRACSIKAYRTYGITVKAKLYADDDTDRYFHIYYKAKSAPRSRK